jgi:dolichyl-diphosphooligosaccharide--protein glycosyltransferase
MNINKFLKPEDINIKNIKTILFLFFLLSLSVVINFNARIYEKNIWLENPSVFFVDDVPLVRTGDPAYYLKIAQYLKRNESIDDYFNKLNYPNITKDARVPLISIIISYLAKGPSLKEIVSAGNFLVLTCSVITTIGIFFMFHSIGRPFEGIVASVGAGISSHYLGRSSFGYIDTDILNLFFMYFLFAIIYLASKKQSWYKNTVYIIFAGLVGKLFYLWYPKPELIYISFL